MMLHPTRNRAALALCLLGAGIALCVNGFILVRYSRPVPCLQHLVPMKQSRGAALIQLVQTSQDVLYEDGVPSTSTTIYPTDTLVNISVNSTHTLAPDIAYFYLQNTLGLSEETMWKITLESGSVLGMTPRNLERKVSLLRRMMNLSDEDVRIMLGKQPALLHYSADRNLAPTILFLVRALDLSKSDLRSMVMDCPSILGYSLGNLKKKIAFFHALGYSTDGIRELLVGTPKLLLSAVDTGLIPRMKFLLNEIQFSLEELRIVYQKNPRLLMYSLDDNLREKVIFFFILQLNMEPEHVRKILLSFPQVMDYNLENHMKPIAEYFITELKFSAIELGSIVLKFPRLFSYSLSKIKHVTGFLRYELDLDPRQAKRVIFQAPQLIGLDTEGNLKQKLDFVKNRLGLTAVELGDVFSKMPTMMCIGIQNNLRPKLEYLEGALADKDHPNNQLLKEAILKQPTLLGYSLQGRIQPRMDRLVAAGISPNKITVGISMSEAKFQQWLSSSQSRKFTHSIIVKRNSTVAGVLVKELNFSEEELNTLCSELPQINDWTVQSLRSWISYMKEMLGITAIQLKNTLLSCPLLVDGSSRSEVRRRLKRLHSVDVPLIDNLDTMYLSREEFDSWFSQKKKEYGSKIAYLQRELGLSLNEERSILSKIPALESTRTNTVYQHKLKYFIAHLSNSTEDVKAMLLYNPRILDRPINQAMERRMRELRLAGVSDPRTMSNLISMDDDAFLKNMTVIGLKRQYAAKVEYLESTLQLNGEDVDSILLSLSNSLTAGDDIESVIDFLLGLGDVHRVKDAVLEHPHLLSFRPHELENILDERKSVLPTTEGAIATLAMTNEDYQTCLSLNKLQNMLDFTQNEMNSILLAGKNLTWQNSTLTLATKIDYMLSQGSKEDVKNAIISRPQILLYPLEKLHNMSKLAIQSSRFATLRFRNESGVILRDELGIAEEDVDIILSRSRYLSLRDPDDFLLPKLNYLLSEFDGRKEHLASCILANPGLLDYSLHDWIMPRMKLLADAGLAPSKINVIASLSPQVLNQRTELQSHLNLTDSELELLVPMETWLGHRRLRQSGPIIEYLASQLNGCDLKLVLFEESNLLTLSLSKTIQPRMAMLLKSGCPPTDISKIVMLTKGEAHEHCSKSFLRRKFGFSEDEVNCVFKSVGTRQSLDSLIEQVDYISQHLFKSSKRQMKAAVVQNPALLKQSLNKILQPRMEVLRYLESMGVEYRPSNMASFFTQSDSSFAKELVPQMKTWHTPLSDELDRRYSGEDAHDIIYSEQDRILATLKDFISPVAMTYSDESNREGARVVHWR